MQDLIQHEGSLTEALKQYGELRIEVLSQEFDANNNFIRTVNLLVNNTPWVKAIVTIPQATYQHFKEILDNLGNNSIGEVLLFKYPFQRSEFEYEIIAGKQARRSTFTWQQHQILVTEVFLILPSVCK